MYLMDLLIFEKKIENLSKLAKNAYLCVLASFFRSLKFYEKFTAAYTDAPKNTRKKLPLPGLSNVLDKF